MCFAVSNVQTNWQRPFAEVKIGKLSAHFLVDTGASLSVVSQDFFRQIPGHWKMAQLALPQWLTLTSADGTTLKHKGMYEFPMRVLGRDCRRVMLVVEGLNVPGILGVDFITEEGVVIDGATNSVVLKTPAQRLANRTNTTQWGVAALVANQRTWLPPMATTSVPCSTLTSHGARVAPGEEGITENAHFSPLGVLEAISKIDSHGNLQVVVINASHTGRFVERRQQVGVLTNAADWQKEIFSPKAIYTMSFGYVGKDPSEKEADPSPLQGDEKETFLKKLQLECPPEWGSDYSQLLLRYHDVCSKDKFDLGISDVIKHTIRMKSEEPIHVKQFRIPLAHEQLIQTYVDELLRRGCIRVSRSPYNSPIFAVKKPHSQGLRIVLDFRMLNKNSYSDRYVIREVKDCIDQIGKQKSRIFSSLDLTSGFWQQTLAEDSRQYTAFTVPGMLRYEFNVTPMGLQGSPSSFARMTDYIMRGLTSCITYIDDLLIHSCSHQQHLSDLELCLKRLRKYNLKLNMGKSKFGCAKLAYLGYTLHESGVSPGVEKLQAVEQAPCPDTLTGVRRFCGLTNYFRMLLPNFSMLIQPLTKLTRKDSGYTQGPLPKESVAAFEKIKKLLCSKPVIAYPLKGVPFRLAVDAALGSADGAGGLGAMLTQVQDGTERVIAYASRALVAHERNYSAYLLELQAAVWAIDHYDVYLRGRRFTLLTDHKPLENLGKVHSKTLNRLQQQLLEFDFDIQYRPGVNNAAADFLSRSPIMEIKAQNEGLRRAQQLDTTCANLINWIAHGLSPASPLMKKFVKIWADKCFIQDEILWINLKQKGRKTMVAAFAPEEMHQDLLRAAHQSPLGGHAALFKTLTRIRQAFFWPGMSADVARMLKKCQTCQMAGDKNRTTMPLRPLRVPSGPNERVHIDLVGPLKPGVSGNKWLCVVTDAYTKYTEICGIKNKESKTVAEAFYKLWWARRSAPLQLVSDLGKEFTGHVLRDLLSFTGTQPVNTSAYHPQSNCCERMNRTMIRYFRSMLADNETLEWETWLPALMLFYNTAIHKCTLNSPFFLTYFHEPRLPNFDIEKPKKLYGESWPKQAFDNMQMAYKLATENSQEACVLRKRQYDRRAKNKVFQVGDRVLLRSEQATKTQNHKFIFKWHGIFHLTRLLPNDNAEIRLSPTAKPKRIHFNRLKLFYAEMKDAPTFSQEEGATNTAIEPDTAINRGQVPFPEEIVAPRVPRQQLSGQARTVRVTPSQERELEPGSGLSRAQMAFPEETRVPRQQLRRQARTARVVLSQEQELEPGSGLSRAQMAFPKETRAANNLGRDGRFKTGLALTGKETDRIQNRSNVSLSTKQLNAASNYEYMAFPGEKSDVRISARKKEDRAKFGIVGEETRGVINRSQIAVQARPTAARGSSRAHLAFPKEKGGENSSEKKRGGRFKSSRVAPSFEQIGNKEAASREAINYEHVPLLRRIGARSKKKKGARMRDHSSDSDSYSDSDFGVAPDVAGCPTLPCRQLKIPPPKPPPRMQTRSRGPAPVLPWIYEDRV